MNRKHVSKVGKYVKIACLLLVCATVQSCRDEYYYDDKEPDFLGSSIYGYLEEQGNFENFLRVIEDLDYQEVLSKTGSKTLFVADDKAFMDGIKEKWGFSKYEELTKAHKRIILNNAMLDNAYLLEMLSKWPSADALAEPTAGRCLRLETSANVTDTIGFFYDKDLPQNNAAWDRFRNTGIRLALDATPTTMVFFTGDYLYQSNITNSDLDFILGGNAASTSSDIYVFDKKVLLDKSNVTCKNGYVHQLDGLLISPSNMAEEIRSNGETDLFSRMLDRFAVPVPISKGSEISETYNRIYHFGADGEQLYEKRYYTAESERGAQKKDGGFLSYKDVDEKSHDAVGSLYFDPGWNAYQAGTSGTPKEQDMAAIFAPTDDALLKYFTDGQGKSLITRYAHIEDPTLISSPEALTSAVDSIPVDILQALLRNLMQISFKSAVPSKFVNILDDARDAMNVSKEQVRKSLIANNGIVYLMDTVFSPARYVAVTAPVMLDDSLLIANRAIEELDYDKYLLSMQNMFGLIVPTNSAMIFYDPYTANSSAKRYAYKFVYIEKDDVVKVEKWNAYENGVYGPLVEKEGDYLTEINRDKLLKEMLEYYIVPDDMEADEDRAAGRKYYMTKGYGTIKVGRDQDGHVNAFAGGRELQNGTMIYLEHKPDVQKNGQTYRLSTGMMHPATQSVYDVLSKTTEFNSFYKLCRPTGMETLFKYVRNIMETELKMKNVAEDVFDIFSAQTKKIDNAVEFAYNVRMFDTYHYTVYVPSNEAVQRAHDQGLPTWDLLDEERKAIQALEASSDADTTGISSRKKELKAGVDLILNFVKYHFQDNSVYVDNVPHVLEIEGQEPEKEIVYATSALNAATNKFCSVLVKTDVDPATGKETVSIRGDFGEGKNANSSDCFNVCYVIRDDEAATDTKEHKLYNIMTRDVDYNGGEFVYTSSYAVVHQIQGGLGFLVNDVIYDAEKNQFKK